MTDNSTILIVDDQLSVRNVLQALLTKQGYNLAFANNGQEALKQAAELTPDLILLDVMMPDMDGWDVYQQMKADDRTRDIPVIIVTAKAQNIDKVLGLHIAKVEDYIAKPFSPDELVASVTKIFSERSKSS